MKKAERLPFRVTQKLTPWLPGIPEVLDFPWSTEGDDVDMCEHVRQTGELYCSSLGDAWGAAIPSRYSHYNPAPAQQQRRWEEAERERQLARERKADIEWKQSLKDDETKERERLDKDAAIRDKNVKRWQLAADLEELRKRDEAERADRARHAEVQNKSEWLVRAERRVKRVTDWAVEALKQRGEVADAELIWRILRYQNLGDGRSARWDPAMFMHTVEHIRRTDTGGRAWAYEDIEACHAKVASVWRTEDFQRKLKDMREEWP